MHRWVWLVMVVACGDNTDQDAGEGVRDGSRIKIPWFEFADGTRQWQPELGWDFDTTGIANLEVLYDAKLDVLCTPELWLDGVTRCMPRTENAELKLYADAGCTARVTTHPEMYRFVADYDPKCGVNRLWHVYPVTHTMPAPATIFYKEPSGRCWSMDANADTLGVVGDEMLPDRFAAISVGISDDADRIHVRYHQSDDGMRLPIGLQDDLLGPASLGSMYAYPDATSQTYFADAACTELVVAVEKGCAPPSSAYGANGYARVDERVEAPATLYWSTGDYGCSPVPPDGAPGPSDYYRVDPSSVPIADMVTSTDAEPGRRIQLQHAFIGKRPVRTRTLVDTELGIECKPHRFPDDVYRCTPRGGYYLSMFTDAACSNPISLASIGYFETRPRYLFDDQSTTDGPFILRELGEHYSGALWWNDGTSCVAIQGGDYFELGGDVAWDTFASATLTTH